MSSESENVAVEAEINRLIETKASKDDLLMILGEVDGALFASPSDKKSRGLRFFRNALERIQDGLCASEFAQNQGKSPIGQRNALAIATMLDFLGAKGAATVSVLILQIGLENVCAGRWKHQFE